MEIEITMAAAGMIGALAQLTAEANIAWRRRRIYTLEFYGGRYIWVWWRPWVTEGAERITCVDRDTRAEAEPLVRAVEAMEQEIRAAFTAEEGDDPVISAYLDRISSMPSGRIIEELRHFEEKLDANVILHVFEIALERKKTSWPYIKAILSGYVNDGLVDMKAVYAAGRGRKRKPTDTELAASKAQNPNGMRREDDKTLAQLERLRAKMHAEAAKGESE